MYIVEYLSVAYLTHTAVTLAYLTLCIERLIVTYLTSQNAHRISNRCLFKTDPADRPSCGQRWKIECLSIHQIYSRWIDRLASFVYLRSYTYRSPTMYSPIGRVWRERREKAVRNGNLLHRQIYSRLTHL